MADGTKAYIEDKDGNKILPATDWSIIQNKPTDLATAGQLPTLGPWQRDGITYKNGGYDWDHVNNGYNCAYRVADMGGFKLVELRLAFASSQDIIKDTEVIELPKSIQADGNEEVWSATGLLDVVVHFANSHVNLLGIGSGKYPANSMVTFHTTYLTTI